MKATTILSLLFGGIMAIAFICCFIYLSNKIDKAYSHALVIDTSGKVYETTTVESAQMRKYEYENHIKMFVNTWYAFDESNYEKNIQTALHWIGNRGKELLSEYRDVDMYNSLIQKNIRYGVLLKDIELDITTLPVSGKIYFTQIGRWRPHPSPTACEAILIVIRSQNVPSLNPVLVLICYRYAQISKFQVLKVII